MPNTTVMSPAEPTLDTLAEPATSVGDGTGCDAVERLFLADPELSCVVLERDDGLDVLGRSRFLTRFAGRLGHGRSLFSRRSVGALAGACPALVLSADTGVLAAGRIALERPLSRRFDDLVVAGPAGLRIVHFATLLSAIAGVYAEQAVQDPLTGLANRRHLVDQLQDRLDRHHEDVCLLFVDVDDFKAVNDSLGHPAGDALLVTIARRLQDAFRGDDLVARLGGDEFVVLLRLRDEQAAQRAADRVGLVLSSPTDLTERRDVPIRCSVGVVLRDGETDAEELLRAADIAMYAAKRGGKGRSAFYRPAMHDSAVERLDLSSALPRAIADGEISVAYQPILDLATGRTVAVEALARWTHPERGPVAPSDFIPLAEELGLVGALGAVVLDTAAREVAGRSPALRVAVNVSAHELSADGFARGVLHAAGAAGLDPTRLTLEVTETALAEDRRTIIGALRELRAAGVAIAIDDFGTGHSSLARLDSLPVDVLKLDKGLVDPLADRPDRGLVRGLLDLARALGVQVVAEGIETTQQRDRLAELRCPLGQGFLFARPMSLHALTHEHRSPPVGGGR